MAIIYTDHLEIRLKIRKFPYDYPKIIYNNPDQCYYDEDQQSFISIKKLLYNGKKRKICIAYTFDGLNVKIKTIHPEKEITIKNRIAKGRWVKQ
ncbi:MAG: hypothetical protein WCV81_04085 [Microgenomates group bacterium]|jgi:hypothetical protein